MKNEHLLRLIGILLGSAVATERLVFVDAFYPGRQQTQQQQQQSRNKNEDITKRSGSRENETSSQNILVNTKNLLGNLWSNIAIPRRHNISTTTSKRDVPTSSSQHQKQWEYEHNLIEHQLRQVYEELIMYKKQCNTLQEESLRQMAQSMSLQQSYEVLLQEQQDSSEEIKLLLYRLQELEEVIIPNLEKIKNNLEERLNAELDKEHELINQIDEFRTEINSLHEQYKQHLQQIELDYEQKISLQETAIRNQLEEEKIISLNKLREQAQHEREEAIQNIKNEYLQREENFDEENFRDQLKESIEERIRLVIAEKEQEINSIKSMMEINTKAQLEQQRAMYEEKLQSMEQECEILLHEEKSLRKVAIEKEKAKMRKLVKAIAIREKKLASMSSSPTSSMQQQQEISSKNQEEITDRKDNDYNYNNEVTTAYDELSSEFPPPSSPTHVTSSSSSLMPHHARKGKQHHETQPPILVVRNTSTSKK